MAADLSDLERQYISDLEATGFDPDRTFWVGDLRPWMDADYFKNLCCHVGLKVKVRVFGNYAFIQFDATEWAEVFLLWFNGVPMPNSSQIFHLKWGTSVYGQVGTSEYQVIKDKIAPPRKYSILLSICFIRINEVKIEKSDSFNVSDGFNVWGIVAVGDFKSDPLKVYYQDQDEEGEIYSTGSELTLTGPICSVRGDNEFSIYANLNVGDFSIAEGFINYAPYCLNPEMRDIVWERDIDGVCGNVTVGFTIVSKAYRATVLVLLIGDVVTEDVYGAIYAVQHNLDTETCVILFEKYDSEKVQAKQAVPLTRSVVVMPCDGLSIQVKLYYGSDCKVVDGDLFFEAKPESQTKNIGSEVVVTITPY